MTSLDNDKSFAAPDSKPGSVIDSIGDSGRPQPWPSENIPQREQGLPGDDEFGSFVEASKVSELPPSRGGEAGLDPTSALRADITQGSQTAGAVGSYPDNMSSTQRPAVGISNMDPLQPITISPGLSLNEPTPTKPPPHTDTQSTRTDLPDVETAQGTASLFNAPTPPNTAAPASELQPTHTAVPSPLESLDPLSSTTASITQNTSDAVNTDPHTHGTSEEPQCVVRKLSLVDGDYFSSREPAEAIPIICTPTATTPNVPLVDLPPTSPPPTDAVPIRRRNVSRSPVRTRHHSRTPSQIDYGVPGSPTQTYFKPPLPVPPMISSLMLNFGDEDDEDSDSDVDEYAQRRRRARTAPPTPHPFDLPTPVAIGNRGDDDDNDLRPPDRSPSFSTISRIPSWVGSFLWSGSNSGTGTPASDEPERRSRSRSVSRNSPSVHARRTLSPPQLVASPSPVSSPEPLPNLDGGASMGYAHVQGRHGRPLPRARPSLEGIQFAYQQGHPTQHPDPVPEHPPPPQEVNITHDTPFAPPPSSYGGIPMSMTTGFGSTGPFGLSTSPSYPTMGKGKLAENPFGTHKFVPIPGAPGFKPDEYDWDKGYSEELEREMRGGEQGQNQNQDPSFRPADQTHDSLSSTSPATTRAAVAERPAKEGSSSGSSFGGYGSRFSFLRRKTEAEKSAHSKSKSQTEPTAVMGSATGNAHVRTASGRSNTVPGPSMERTPRSVPELIERKVGSVVLKERKEDTEGVLSTRVADLIRAHLPPLSRLPKSWSLLYSLDQDGISLNTLYNNCEAPLRNRKMNGPYIGQSGVILAVRDSESDSVLENPEKGSVFGAFVAEGLGKKSKGFFGGGDSFLWKYSKGQLEVFKATGRNTYFVICESDYMGFGGGSTSYGLYLDSGLLEGSSAPCPTFGNKILCPTPPGVSSKGHTAGTATASLVFGKEVKFDCVGLEVWGIGP